MLEPSLDCLALESDPFWKGLSLLALGISVE